MTVIPLHTGGVLSLLVMAASASPAGTDTLYVYFLGGQSNGTTFGLPAEWLTPVQDTWIFHGNTGLDDDDQPDGRVWDFGDVVRKGQARFVMDDYCSSLVKSTEEYGYSDPWHYDSAGYLDLGRRFAEAMAGLRH